MDCLSFSLLLQGLFYIASLVRPDYCEARITPSHAKPSVIIIGAGMSGIMAAKTLAEHGIDDFLILEATDRIGGRMQKANFAGYTIELGANWVEGVGGSKENPIWTLAKKYDLHVSYSDYDNISANTYNEEGHLLPISVTGPRFDIADASYNYSNTLSTSLNAQGEEDISISTAQRLFGLIPTTPLDMAIDYFYYDFEIAEPPRVTSLENVVPNPTFTYFGDDEYFVADKRGYAYIVHQLAKDFLQHENGSIADSRLKLQKVVTEIKYSSHGITVETEDNSTFTSKYAILSVSLGVLKSNLIDFKPDLPHLETEYPGSNILFVTVTDDESRRIEQQSDNETKEEIMEVLKKLFGEGIPDAEEILVPRWWKNRFQGGSYTNWPIGVSSGDFDRMKAPIGPLYFTGEHTSELFNGYVHGAYLAGIATAETLLDCIKKGHCDELTSDGPPWTKHNLTRADNLTAGSCKGACCVDVQQERETLRQIYLATIDALQDELAAKCPTP